MNTIPFTNIQLPASIPPYALWIGAFVLAFIAYQILRKVLRVVWAARAVVAIASILGFGGFQKGCSSSPPSQTVASHSP